MTIPTNPDAQPGGGVPVVGMVAANCSHLGCWSAEESKCAGAAWNRLGSHVEEVCGLRSRNQDGGVLVDVAVFSGRRGKAGPVSPQR